MTARDADPRGVEEVERIRVALSAFRWPLRLHGLRVLDDTRESMATAYNKDRASALVILANSAYRASLALPSVEADRDHLTAELAAARAKIEVLQSIAGGEITEQEWNSQAEIDSLTRALAFRDAALRESQAALTVAREGQTAAEREVVELRVSECWHRDRCTDLEREVAPIAAEAREYLPVYDGKPDSHIASVRLGLIRAVAALAADGAGRAGGEDA